METPSLCGLVLIGKVKVISDAALFRNIKYSDSMSYVINMLVFSCIMKVGSNIGPATAGSAGPVPTPLYNADRLPVCNFEQIG